MEGGKSGLEETPTWAVSIFCLFFFVLSFVIDSGLHHLTEFLKKRRRKSLSKALAKIKTEMMKMGFISLLLTISEIPISRICVTEAMASSFLPCKDAAEFVEPAVSSATQVSAASGLKPDSNTSVETADDGSFCTAKGMVPLISRDGVMQLNIFISVLAIFYVSYCLFTMYLGIVKMAKWKSWEEETRTLEHRIVHDPRRFQFTHQTSFGQRHMKFWSRHSLLLWPVCFIRQFRRSISKDDYFTLRHGFITANISGGSNFNFQKFVNRAFDDDFKEVVETRFWIWIFSIFFIFFSAHEFYNYYWLPFIPLMIVLAVSTKLQVIITQMCVQSCSENSVSRGTCLVKPNDDWFWFGEPKWLLHLIQFVMIQNSFQLAFFAWTWYEFGLRSCFNQETQDIAIRISVGAAVQILCGYVTLPLYALVSQMGSGMTKAVFSDRVAEGLKKWHKNARRRLSKSRSISSITSSGPSSADTSISNKYLQNQADELTPETATSPPSSPANVTEDALRYHRMSSASMLNSSTHEITEEESPVIVSKRVVYDGEISFASSWKDSGRIKLTGDCTPMTERGISGRFTGFDR
ncbi:hypothetical protein BT93_K1875 [Corymbia citriodora subsp. variegata]|nr:hypothetical protein BT93_K1875 [Corymbia citriodora subsp. variegata]